MIFKRNGILIALVVALAVIPLMIPGLSDREEPFAGADGQAEGVIVQSHPGYKPWFEPFWEPPSGEIESMLFALQAALGAGVLAYYLGYRRARAKFQEKSPEHVSH